MIKYALRNITILQGEVMNQEKGMDFAEPDPATARGRGQIVDVAAS